jgi:predicted transposase/invertase (TIGR01784 family)
LESIPKLSSVHDHFSRELLGNPERAAEFLANYLRPEVAALLDMAKLEVVKSSFIDSELREFFSDLIYRVRLGHKQDAFVYILFEHKSAPDEWVAFQVLRYMVKIWEQAAKDRQRLPPIIPLVFYHGGAEWQIDRNFRALVDLDDEAECLREGIPNFLYQLIDLSTYAADDLRGSTKLRLSLLALKNVFRPDQQTRIDELMALGSRLPGEYEDGVEYLLKVLTYYITGAKGIAKEDLRTAVRQALPRQEEQIMSTLAEEWVKEGFEEGFEKGIEKGIEQGIEQGMSKGAADLALRLLERKLGPLSAPAHDRILALPAGELEELCIALQDFNSQNNLSEWLAKRS